MTLETSLGYRGSVYKGREKDDGGRQGRARWGRRDRREMIKRPKI